MFSFSAHMLVAATGGRLLHPVADEQATYALCTDSRSLQPGQLFVALSGDRFDGHDFLRSALELPGTGVMGQADRLQALPSSLCAGRVVLAVEDSLRALGDAASFARATWQIPVVGLTGSSGKTSTKDLLRSVLQQTGPGVATEGNLNNLIGLPLMVLKVAPSDRWAVLEMGMNAFGEIARLAEIAAPTVRLITNVGGAHTEGVGGIEGVARAKGELFASARPGDTLVVNADDARVLGLAHPSHVARRTYGRGAGVDVQLVQVELLPDGSSRLKVRRERGMLEVRVPLLGLHNAHNALAAIAVAEVLQVTDEHILEGISRVKLSPMRMAPVQLPGDILVLNDAYNANPASMAAALETLGAQAGLRGSTTQAVAVLGDMLELGALEEQGHREVGRRAASLPLTQLFVCGSRARWIAAGAREAGLDAAKIVEGLEPVQVAQRLFETLEPRAVVLVKGSRGARMERVVSALTALYHPSGTGEPLQSVGPIP